MLIGTQYADNKLYSGIKHYDSLPLTSGDMHEYFDTSYMKNAYIMNNLLGYGTLNTPNISVTESGGISLSNPSIVMIDGDVSLIKNDEDTPLITGTQVTSAGFAEGLVCIVGWYQQLNASSTLRNYGGVENSILPNDMMSEKFHVQISSRFQFRWFPILVNKTSYAVDHISIVIDNRDRDGEKTGTTSTVNSIKRENDVFVLHKPDSMDYAESDLYLVPIANYKYSSGAITEITPHEKLSVMTKMALLQYQSTHVMQVTRETPINLEVPINIPQLTEDDLLIVSYEGVLLYEEVNYRINYERNIITLLGFTTKVGDVVHFSVTKVVNTGKATDISEILLSHMASTGSDTVRGHLYLSDTPSTSDKSQGIAATPKLVEAVTTQLETALKTYTDNKIAAHDTSLKAELKEYADTQDLVKLNSAKNYTNQKVASTKEELTESMDTMKEELETEIASLIPKITDDSTSKLYKLGIDNGLLYIEEV